MLLRILNYIPLTAVLYQNIYSMIGLPIKCRCTIANNISLRTVVLKKAGFVTSGYLLNSNSSSAFYSTFTMCIGRNNTKCGQGQKSSLRSSLSLHTRSITCVRSRKHGVSRNQRYFSGFRPIGSQYDIASSTVWFGRY